MLAALPEDLNIVPSTHNTWEPDALFCPKGTGTHPHIQIKINLTVPATEAQIYNSSTQVYEAGISLIKCNLNYSDTISVSLY